MNVNRKVKRGKEAARGSPIKLIVACGVERRGLARYPIAYFLLFIRDSFCFGACNAMSTDLLLNVRCKFVDFCILSMLYCGYSSVYSAYALRNIIAIIRSVVAQWHNSVTVNATDLTPI